ncbi:MAG: polysaccharide biosynthesis tyrosine autokinase [Imperialibacter sp.]|uniref:GumC family protein n=1 Tax=Imperialibacter sp. TaxID=2038411 RepID=UPI0032EF6D52
MSTLNKKNYLKYLGRSKDKDTIDIHSYLLRLWDYKIWFFLSLISFSFFALVINEYSTPRYLVKASLDIVDQKKSASQTFMKELEFFSPTTNIENEIEVLSSYDLIKKVTESLNLNIDLEEVSPMSEAYEDVDFFTCRLIETTGDGHRKTFLFKIVDENGGYISSQGNGNLGVDSVRIVLGVPIQFHGFIVQIEKKEDIELSHLGRTFRINYSHPGQYALVLKERIQIKPISNKTSIVELSLSSTKPELDIEILDELMSSYLIRELELKNKSANEAIDFIDNQLKSVKENLLIAEAKLEDFRSENKIININQEGISTLNKLHELEKDYARYQVQLKYCSYTLDYLSKTDAGILISPSTAGITDPVLNDLVSSLNSLINQYSRLRTAVSEINPQLLSLASQIAVKLRAVTENIRNQRNTLEIQIGSIEKLIKEVELNLDRVPNDERRLINIQREFDLNEEVYIYLLKQKSEAEIAKEGNETSSRLVDPAYVSSRIYPRSNFNVSVAIIFGFFMPILGIGFYDFFRTTIHSPLDITRGTDIPIIGCLPAVSMNKAKFPNLQFEQISEDLKDFWVSMSLLLPSKEYPKTILYLSYLQGEGKSFSSLNTAILAANSGYSTLIVDLDNGNKNLSSLFGYTGFEGVEEFFIENMNLDKLARKTDIGGLEIIQLGAAKDYSTILMNKPKLEMLLERLKKTYDCVVFDSSSLELTPDALTLSTFVDFSVFVVSHKKTQLRTVEILNQLKTKIISSEIGILYNNLN